MSLKSSILQILPEAVRQPIRKIYYLQSVKFFKKTDELAFLSSMVRRGDVVIDIGANIGIYTKCISELVGPAGKVFSIEPVPSTFDILQYNVKKLHLENVALYNCALSDVNKEVVMSVPVHPTGREDFYRAGIVGNSQFQGNTITIASKTLDSLLGKGIKVSFIKCDVEGHELQVIRGAMETITHSMPVMLVEITRNPEDKNSDAFEIFAMVKKRGYEIFWLNGNKLQPYSPGITQVNYFFIPHGTRI
jgi:FkbM family methyltransferase